MKEIIKKNYKYFILIGLLIILLLNNKNLRKTNSINNQNIEALKDSVRVGRTKNGETEYLIKTLIANNKKDVERLNSELYEELKKEFGKVSSIAKVTTIIKYDTIRLNNEIIKYPNGYNGIVWSYDTTYNENNFKHIKGLTKFRIGELGEIYGVSSSIIENEDGIDIVLGYKDNGNGVEIFARSEHPYFSVNKIQSVIIPKNDQVLNKYSKGKRLFVGPYIGFGLSYDLKITPNIGFGVGYNLNR